MKKSFCLSLFLGVSVLRSPTVYSLDHLLFWFVRQSKMMSCYDFIFSIFTFKSFSWFKLICDLSSLVNDPGWHVIDLSVVLFTFQIYLFDACQFPTCQTVS